MLFRYTWITNEILFDVLKEGFQTLVIPKSGIYSFEVVGAGNEATEEFPGARICGKIRLERGDKITVALGQPSKGRYTSGSGGTFVVKETRDRPEPIFVAGGAGYSFYYSNYGKASLAQTANGNNQIGSSGVQLIQQGDVENFYCAGAGFFEAPDVGQLCEHSEPPQNYFNGLMGGKGFYYHGRYDQAFELEGGFGGGGANIHRYLNRIQKVYFGGGGGYTGGSSRIIDPSICHGGGGGSFSADQDATFDYKYEKFGKCKIEFISNSSE